MNVKVCLLLVLFFVFLTYTDAHRGYKRGHKDPPKYDRDDDDHDRDKEDECKEEKDGKHGMKECEKRHWAKVLVCVGIGIAVVSMTVGITICVCRYKRRMRQQISDSKVNLQAEQKRSALYIVEVDASDLPPPYSQEKPTAPPGYPVVSDQELPGKE